MKEELLHYIWQSQQQFCKELVTTKGEAITIVRVGVSNKHAGPDFLEAYLDIGGVMLHGHVELHVKTSDWYAHGHDKDSAYDNVILHVVWNDDQPSFCETTRIPTLVLKDFVPHEILTRYQMLMEAKETIPCMRHLQGVPLNLWHNMIRKALMERLRRKYDRTHKLLVKNNYESEITTYQLLAYSFGFRVNSVPFLALSEQVDWGIVQQNAHDLTRLEALFLGQAGFLKTPKAGELYVKKLKEIYLHLKKKYKLASELNSAQWKFFRVRPSNFPTFRIAQFASFLHKTKDIFYLFINASPKTLHKELSIVTSLYWQKHYAIGKPVQGVTTQMGKASINSIIINTVVPLLVTYGKLRDEYFYTKKALSLLKKLPPEKNYITKQWEEINMPIDNAFFSQGSIALWEYFCSEQKCLSCHIGNHILQKSNGLSRRPC